MRRIASTHKIAAVFFLLTFSAGLQAQSTLDAIQTLVGTKCTPGCHSGPSPSGDLDLSGSAVDLYNAIVEKTPTNPAAAAKGYKLIDPGYLNNSFLFRKIARADWDDYYPINEPSEGGPMPKTGHLQDEEIELFRQWILFGAPLTGEVVDQTILADYYGGLGKKKVETPAAPDASEGFQVRFGTFFLGPLEEKEYFKKFPLSIPDSVEVTRAEVFFNIESHHFIVYKFEGGSDVLYSDGIRDLQDFGDNVSLVLTLQDEADLQTPEGSAWFWEPDPVLDFNFHLPNYDPDSVLACDVYVNFYTRPRQPQTIQMHSILLPIDALAEFVFGTGTIGESLVIPNDGVEHTFVDDFYIPLTPAPEWHLWMLSSHTHSRGTDYDVYTRENGEQIFEGFFNLDYTFNQGFYDWEHPAVRFFDPLLKVNMGLFGGFQQVATYVNSGPDTLHWGPTTADEMMLIFLQYTEEPLPESTGLDGATSILEGNLGAGPNPFTSSTRIWYDLPLSGHATLELFDVIGKKHIELYNDFQTAGRHHYNLSSGELQLTPGTYMLKLSLNGNSTTTKLLHF